MFKSRWLRFLITFVVIFALNVLVTHVFYYPAARRPNCLPYTNAAGQTRLSCPLHDSYNFWGVPPFFILRSGGSVDQTYFYPAYFLLNIAWTASLALLVYRLWRLRP